MRPGGGPPTSGSLAFSLPTPKSVAPGVRDCLQRTVSLTWAHGQEDAPRGQPSVAKPRDERVNGLDAMIRTKRRGNSVIVEGQSVAEETTQGEPWGSSGEEEKEAGETVCEACGSLRLSSAGSFWGLIWAEDTRSPRRAWQAPPRPGPGGPGDGPCHS